MAELAGGDGELSNDLRTLFRSVAPLEASVARYLTRHSFGELCNHLGRKLAPDEVPMVAAGFVRTWIDEGGIATLGVASSDATLTAAGKAA